MGHDWLRRCPPGVVVAMLCAAFWLASVPAVFAQTAPPAATAPFQSDSSARVTFGSEIRFQLLIRSTEPVQSVVLLYQVDDSIVQNTGTPAYQPGTSVTATYSWRVANVLVPGTEIRYSWQVELAGGRKIAVPEQTIAYNDTRFTWQEARGDKVTVYYHAADPEAGRAVLTEASALQQRLSREYGLTLDQPLRIYAYTREQDYTSALAASRPAEMAIIAGTDRVFVLAPGGTSGMVPALVALRRQVGLAIFMQKTKNPYAEPPYWLSQGFASLMGGEEISQANNQALGQYAQANRLLPLKSLNTRFPASEQEEALAYVESISAVRFIIESYGPEKMRALLAAFKEGNTADDAVKKGLGVTLDQMETRWKNTLKKGTAQRPGTATSAGQPVSTTNLGPFDGMLGPAVRYWEGVLGPAAKPVMLGAAGFIGLGIVTLFGSIGFSVWKRARDGGEE